MAREARCSIAIRGVSISPDAPADGRRPIHNDDSMRSSAAEDEGEESEQLEQPRSRYEPEFRALCSMFSARNL
jgi:hypothetical protein